MEYNNWKEHHVVVTFPHWKFEIAGNLSVKDLSEEQQQKYHDFLLSIKKRQEEFIDKFVFVSSDISNDFNEIEAWNKYPKEYGLIVNDWAERPTVDTWTWESSIGKITLKDIYYASHLHSNLLYGAVFFVWNDKYELACLNDGRNMVQIRVDGKLYRKFNQQLTSYNYIRAKRITYDPRRLKMLL